MPSGEAASSSQPRRLKKAVTEPVPRTVNHNGKNKAKSWLETAVVGAVFAVIVGTILAVSHQFKEGYVESLREAGAAREKYFASLEAETLEPEQTQDTRSAPEVHRQLSEEASGVPPAVRSPEDLKESVPSALQEKFASLDGDGSGELSYRELLPLLQPGVALSQLEAVMQSLDADGSGGVDVLEYAGAMTQRPVQRQRRQTTLPGPNRTGEIVDNAPRPPMRPGDVELKSLAPGVLNGSTPIRMHGHLGRMGGKARRPTVALPAKGLTDKARTEAHRGFCFNSRVSDSISLDRKQQDVRSEACRQKHASYPADLPSATIIVVFHNEHISVLLRTLHSILNHSPPDLLAQLILLDDASVPTDRFDQKHWEALQVPLAEYCQSLPKTQLVRLGERRGLMMARMEGVWRATGDVVIFLDSHIEATPGWMQPLLARIKEDPKKVVLPKVDSIDAETFQYTSSPRDGIGVLGFSWSLGQRPWPVADYGQDGTQPSPSPIMPGGLFGADRREFLMLGGYDQEMRLYGGEEMEISFRTWMCGGAIEHVPCSHVGHVFRTPKYWQGQVYEVPGEEIARNKLRAAEVWLDDYKKLMQYATMLLPKRLSLGDVSARKSLRQRLGCAGFEWYLQTVAQGMHVPNISDTAHVGALQNVRYGACLDTLGHSGHGQSIELFTCHGQRGAQAFVMGGDGMVRLPQTNYIGCVAKKNSNLIIEVCDPGVKNSRWSWDANSMQFRPVGKSKCLEVRPGGSKFLLSFAKCRKSAPEQQWFWDA